jgi:hypothetical protein
VDSRLAYAAAVLTATLFDGLADGLRQHLPDAVGILLKSAAICLSAAFAHVILDVSTTATTVSAGAGTIVLTVNSALRFVRGRE